MLESPLELLILALGFLGGVALLRRVVRSVIRLFLHLAEGTAASGLAEVSARRGDLTGLSERRAHQERARRLRRIELLLLTLWAAWLLVPPLAGFLPEGYAPAALLWLLRDGPIVRRTSITRGR